MDPSNARPDAPASGPAAAPTLDDDAFVALVAKETGTDTGEVRQMLDAVRRGEDLEAYFGLTPAIQASLENCGVAYYRGQRVREARQVFEALVYLTQGRRASAWRGAAACYQLEHDYAAAVQAYASALVLDDGDTLSAAHCGECLCLLGRREEGLAMLQALLEDVPASEAKAPHVLRAAALVAAGGGPGTPSPLARSSAGHGTNAASTPPPPRVIGTPNAGAISVRVGGPQSGATPQRRTQASAASTPTPADADVDVATPNDPDAPAGADGAFELDLATLEQFESSLERRRKLQPADPGIAAQLADPEARARLDALAKAVHQKSITIRTLADFSDEQMDAGYAVACTYLERGELMQAMHTCMTMLYIDSRDARFYQLAGLTAHHMKLWCLADYLYALHGIWSPTGPDAATLIYQGEAKMLTAEPEAGLALVREGVARGGRDPQMAELVRRGEALLKQGANMEAKFAEFTLGGLT